MNAELYKAIRLVVNGEYDDAIGILELAGLSMGGLGQCDCCCGINPHSSSDKGFGDFLGLDVDPDLRWQPNEIGHKLDCNLAIALSKLGCKMVFMGDFTESDRVKLLKNLKELEG